VAGVWEAIGVGGRCPTGYGVATGGRGPGAGGW
jgi:hypothetical protein